MVIFGWGERGWIWRGCMVEKKGVEWECLVGGEDYSG